MKVKDFRKEQAKNSLTNESKHYIEYNSNYMKFQRKQINKLKEQRKNLIIYLVLVTIMFVLTAIIIGNNLLNKIEMLESKLEYSLTQNEEQMQTIEEYKQFIVEKGYEAQQSKVETNQNVSRGTRRNIDNANFKSYMHYDKITSTNTKQFELKQIAITDEYGFRKIGDAYCIALGSYYGEVGTLYNVHLSNGVVFTAIKAEAKSDVHTDDDNIVDVNNGSVIEFLVDCNVMSQDALRKGNLSKSFDWLNAKVEKIEKI